MELTDLKKTWGQISTGRELDEGQLRQMLGRRTNSLIGRIDRNIRIGFAVIFVLILIFTFDDLLVSPKLVDSMTRGVEIPNWLVFLGIFSNALLFTTFVYFVIKYYRVKRSCNINCDLRETLQKIIDTLLLYQRLFYLALATVMVAIGSAFISGIYVGEKMDIENQGAQLADIDAGKLILVIVIGLIILAVIIGVIFFFLRWGFRKLYGNYIHKLKDTLLELEEIEPEIE